MAKLQLPESLVSVDWLYANFEHEDLVIFDGSWHMPATGRDALSEWRQAHIPGARFFDFDGKIADPDSALPHMMPSEAIFTREVQALGLNQDSVVVVYDTMGMFASPRVWWMLRAMGCRDCALLDGGLVAWNAAGYPSASVDSLPEYQRGNFIASLDPAWIADAAEVAAALDDRDQCVLDARQQPRFSGAAEEPRPGLRRGHMPGALNLPFAEMFDNGLLKSRTELAAIFAPLLEGRERTICSCGSGVTACIIGFAALQAGYENLAVYDGSWCEWGLPDRDYPVVVD